MEYQEANNPVVVTRTHIFLNKKEVINYTKRGYVLLLKKINEKEAFIESETYSIDKLGHKELERGASGSHRIGKSFDLVEYAKNGDRLFKLKIVLEKYFPMKS